MAYPYTNAPPGGVYILSRAEFDGRVLIIDRLMQDFPGPWWNYSPLHFDIASPTPEIPSTLCIYRVFVVVRGEFKLLEESDACPTPEAAVENLRLKILYATFYKNAALFPVGPDYDA
ncbi:hypothetical protein BFW01_g10828 [Lasiodiplodia theobromae]|uniref:Uncharacterized protein n=1 Tax=Lasiodiplodia theobromae TaxID=45133 RepID=A0A8H7IPY7_9PEZI|nr:hypothetical protein BFW01_g10828 [Lasiodiplodia theobromae]